MSRREAHDGLDEWTLVDEAGDNNAEEPASKGDTSEETKDGTSDPAIPEGFVRVRLRIGEDVRPAYFQATQRVEDFLEKFFAKELQQGKRIRLIYMGMLLIADRPMGEYGVEEDGVIHAVITDSAQTPHPEKMPEVPLKGLATPTNTLLVSTGFVLYGLWTVHYYYPQLFSWKATLLLGTLSVAHVSATVSRIVH